MKVVLIDYGAGNIRSVANALNELGIQPEIVADPAGLDGATHLVLPGVGSFGDCMARLEERGLASALRERIAAGTPYLGICLGYQILFETSEETSAGVAGLGIFKGKVKRFEDQPGLKVPHMGWNSVVPRQPDSGFWQDLGSEPYFYYVHSYFPVPADDSIIAAETTYGSETFAASIQTDKILAAQFHPEKSQDAGQQLLKNFFALTA
ncbi:imidazole glycerol phosphate synthase subunit HisH [Luteolibacter sp. LG18]|uniref:imidazole glycerol phosphate synthase subunit HisH n=1 Tax=Luteolibacter sp. LG18 TaxID=2819286 RepID=UPI002B2F04B0|nr:imidazole glycerol phosphate synthase subunit HisH [Luteolibacter sp. LG18]